MSRQAKIKELSIELQLPEITVEEEFDFLDVLRESGAVNMFGAVSYLQENNDTLDKVQATKILKGWMDSYGK